MGVIDGIKGFELSNRAKEKVKNFTEMLIANDVFFTEYPNGQVKIDNVNVWVTSEKWYDEKKFVKGQGLNSLMKYLKQEDIL